MPGRSLVLRGVVLQADDLHSFPCDAVFVDELTDPMEKKLAAMVRARRRAFSNKVLAEMHVKKCQGRKLPDRRPDRRDVKPNTAK